MDPIQPNLCILSSILDLILLRTYVDSYTVEAQHLKIIMWLTTAALFSEEVTVIILLFYF